MSGRPGVRGVNCGESRGRGSRSAEILQAQVEQDVGYALVVVAQHFFFAQKIAGDTTDAEALNLFDVGNNLLRAFRSVALPRAFGDRAMFTRA